MSDLFDRSSNPEIPRQLRYRFRRERPELLLPLFWAVVAGLIAWLGLLRFETLPADSTGWVLFGGCILSGMMSLALLCFAIYFGLMAFTPLTILEISAHPMGRGQSQQMAVIQRPPNSMRLLRVSLECREEEITWYRTPPETLSREWQFARKKRTIGRQRTVLLETRVLAASGSDPAVIVQEFTIPSGATPTRDYKINDRQPLEKQKAKAITWFLQLHGWTTWGIPFWESFEVTVL